MREILYGRHPVRECLRARHRHIHSLILAEGVRTGGIVGEILGLAAGLKLPVKRVPRLQLDRIAEVHQGVALEVGGYPYVEVDAILGQARKVEELPFILAHCRDRGCPRGHHSRSARSGGDTGCGQRVGWGQ